METESVKQIIDDIRRAWSECETESADNRARMERAFKKAYTLAKLKDEQVKVTL